MDKAADVLRLLAAYLDLGTGFDVFVIGCGNEAVRASLRQRLNNYAKNRGWSLAEPRSRDGIVQPALDWLTEVLAQPPPARTLFFLPLPAASSEETEILLRLNEHRDNLRRDLKGALCLVGLGEFLQRVPGDAPDLWSGRTREFEIAASPARPASRVEPRPFLLSLPPPGPDAEVLLASDLTRLEQLFATSRVVVIAGAAGTGKTVLARAYLHRHEADYLGGIFWVDFEESSRAAAVRRLAREAGIALTEPASEERQLGELAVALNMRAPNLVVLNFVPQEEATDDSAARWIVHGGNTRVLVTTEFATGLRTYPVLVRERSTRLRPDHPPTEQVLESVLAREDQTTARALLALAVFEGAWIPLDLLGEMLATDGLDVDAIGEVVDQLAREHLLARAARDRIVLRSDVSVLLSKILPAEAMTVLRRLAARVVLRRLRELSDSTDPARADVVEPLRVVGRRLARAMSTHGEHDIAFELCEWISRDALVEGDAPAAEQWAKWAIESAGEDTERLIQAKTTLSLALAMLGRHTETLSVVEDVIARRTARTDGPGKHIALLLMFRANILAQLGRLPEAEKSAAEGLTAAERVQDISPLERAQSMEQVALIQQERGRLEDALATFNRALALREQVLGTEHPELVDNLIRLATILGLQGRHAQAYMVAQRAHGLVEHLRGSDHGTMLPVQLLLGAIQESAGNLAAAREAYGSALNLARRLFGDRHINVGTALQRLATLSAADGDLGAAVSYGCAALEILRAGADGQNPTVVAFAARLAEWQNNRGH